ncbi:MAG TPA: peptidoglycan DD-metalloendopeptidase family protein [Nevskiales bacterium]|nr:peptidoglycan DD-metalloendopeptidase family protein [Nevskiales bacterium]
MKRIEADYSRQPSAFARQRARVLHWLGIGSAALPVIVLVAALSPDAGASRQRDSVTSGQLETRMPAFSLAAQQPLAPIFPQVALADRFASGRPKAVAVTAQPAPELESYWMELEVKPGDTIGALFARHGLADADWREIMRLGGDTGSLAHIRAGSTLQVRQDKAGQLLELRHQIDEIRSLQVTRQAGVLRARTVAAAIERRTTYRVGVINEDTGSLFLAGQEAGMSDRVIMQLFDVFRWDIDFAQDIQPGDRFSVVYEEVYRNGEKLRDGEILAAEFINRGKPLRAIAYAGDDGRLDYYTPKGDPMHKAFIRTPVAFSRISSRFGFRRHPVLNRIRAHKGVDYAAPTGTPVKATGDGRIIHRGRRGGYGNTVMIQHANGIVTLYGHLSKFAKGQSIGSRVKQGQLIGYVGSTGLATGPHLHYEFHVNGVHQNPLSVKLPNAEPLNPRRLADFRAKAAPLLAQLDALSHIQIALRE